MILIQVLITHPMSKQLLYRYIVFPGSDNRSVSSDLFDGYMMQFKTNNHFFHKIYKPYWFIFFSIERKTMAHFPKEEQLEEL